MADRLLYTPASAAAMLNTSVKMLRHLTDEGRIKFVRVGKRRRYTPDDMAQFIEDQKEELCPFTERRARPTTTMTSNTRVIDFTVLRDQERREKRKR